MARHAKPLYAEAEERFLQGYIAEWGTVLQGAQPQRVLHMMLTFAARPAGPLSVPPVPPVQAREHAFTFGMAHALGKCQQLLASFEPAALSIVVRLPPRHSVDAQGAALIDEVLDGIWRAPGHTPGLMVACAANPYAWDLRTPQRHVITSHAEGAADAWAVFLALATLWAPSAVMECEPGDVLEILGDAKCPSYVVRGCWSEQGGLQMERVEKSSAAAAQRAFVCSLRDVERPGDCRGIVQAWQQAAPAGCATSYNLSAGVFSTPASDGFPVLALCQARHPMDVMKGTTL